MQEHYNLNIRIFVVTVALLCIFIQINFGRNEVENFEAFKRPIKVNSSQEEKEIYKIIEVQKQLSKSEKYWRIDKQEKVAGKLQKQEERKLRKLKKNETMFDSIETGTQNGSLGKELNSKINIIINILFKKIIYKAMR